MRIFPQLSGPQTVNPGPLALDLDEIQSKQEFKKSSRLQLVPGSIRSLLSATVLSDLAQPYGPLPRVNFANVVIEGKLWGTYLSYETFGKDFIQDRFDSKKGERWAAYPGTRLFAITGATDLKAHHDLKSGGIDDDDAWERLASAAETLSENAGHADEVLDVDQILWRLAFERVFAVMDGIDGKTGASLYESKRDDRFRIVSYGGREALKDATLAPLPASTEKDSLLARLIVHPAWKQRYLAHFKTIVRRDLSLERIEQSTTLRGKALSTATGQSAEKAVAALKDFVTRRIGYLDSHPALKPAGPVISETSPESGSRPTENQPITVTARLKNATEARLFYSTGKSLFYSELAMKKSATTGALEAEIPPQTAGTPVRFYIEANNEQATSYEPALAEAGPVEIQFRTSKTGDFAVRINEVLPANSETRADPQGDYDDYIELHNTSDEVIDLSGHYLSDKSTNLDKWEFPEGTKIPAKGYLIVWADEDGKDTPGLHANFKLSKNGETLFLSAPDEKKNVVLDKMTFEDLGDDEALLRSEDGEKWETGKGSPGKANG